MQIFECQDRVTSQIRQQVESNAQSCAFTLLAAGHRPPPWLLPSCAGDPQELNGKPIVSELLFPGGQITTPATNRTAFLPPAAPSASCRNVRVPNGYAGLETICDTLDTNQDEVPQQKQVSVGRELAEASSEVNMFPLAHRSRSRQRRIEDSLREKNEATNSGSSGALQDRMQRVKLADVGLNRTTASLSSKSCGDGAHNAETTTSLPGQEKGSYANQGRSNELFQSSKGGDIGNQGINQTVSSENNVPNDCSVTNLIGVQVTDSVCHPPPETYLSVEPKKLQFDGVESDCMNPASGQTMHLPECALESANLELTEAHPLNEDPSSTSCSQVPCFTGRLLLDGVESGYLNPDSAPVKQQQRSALKCASLDLAGMDSKKEDQSLYSSPEVPNHTSVQLLQRDTLHSVEDTERILNPDGFPDRNGIITWSSDSSNQQCSDSHISHPPGSESLQPPTQQADTSSGAPASSEISPDSLVEEDGFEDHSHLFVNDVDSQCSQFRSTACPEQLQAQTVTLSDVYRESLSCDKTQSNVTPSNGCPVVYASVSANNELSQEQQFLARTSLKCNKRDVGTPLGHASPARHNKMLDGKSACDAANCHSGKFGDVLVGNTALTKEHDVSVWGKKDASAVPEVMSCISARRTSKQHITERSSMVPAENLQQDGTENSKRHKTERSSMIPAENLQRDGTEKDKRSKSLQPSVQYFLRSAASHEKISLLESDRSSAACDQKRSVGDGVEVNVSLSPKRRRISCRPDFDIGTAGHKTAINFSGKSQPSGRYFLKSSGTCESMSLGSEGRNDASNHNISVAGGVYGNGNSSCGRRNTTSQLNVVLGDSQGASSIRSTVEGRVLGNSQEQIQGDVGVEFPITNSALPSLSGSLSYSEANCTQQEETCLEGQDLNDVSVADQEMTLQMDIISSPVAILNPENYSGMESLTIFPSYALDQHGEQASAPNPLFHEKICYGSNVELGRKYRSCDPKGHFLSGAAILRQWGDEPLDRDDSMPEFESFSVPAQFDSPTIGKRPFEALYDSRELVTLSSDPSKYDTNTASGMHQLLTTVSAKPTNCSFSDDLQQCGASTSRSIMDSFGAYGLELDSFFISDAVASCSSNASSSQEINETPLTPSVEKYSLGKLSSRSGSEHMGSIPELECFRIDEDSSIAEEDEHQGRIALQDITRLCQNNGNSMSLSTGCMDTGNIGFTAESLSSELSHPTSVKREGKVSRSLHGRLGSTEILRNKTQSRHRSEANVDRRSKPTNIVANMTSFIPLVKPKVQSTTACVKKDVKVKALKAAEAAKRLEEKKQKEQEVRKAAAKLERERLKQEKELKQKLEEEQKKKREIDAATKKRQREEVEKKETVRKRKCIDEARKQHKQPMDRRRATKDEKDARLKASDNMEPRKNLVDVGKNQGKPDETTEPAFELKANKSKDEKVVAVDQWPASFRSDAKENILNSLEESYKMSPYKDSDEEDDDDLEHEQESRRRRKFIPSWARKENLDKILLSNKMLDPREIFAQKFSFNISDVLSAHIPQRGLR